MRSRKLVILLCLVLALAVVTPVYAADDGAALFKTKCAACHGQTGAGDTPMAKKQNIPDLGSAVVQKMSDADLTAMIADGGKDKKPTHAFANKGVTPEQVKALVGYIRSLAKK